MKGSCCGVHLTRELKNGFVPYIKEKVKGSCSFLSLRGGTEAPYSREVLCH
jgi:hypothetical protein